MREINITPVVVGVSLLVAFLLYRMYGVVQTDLFTLMCVLSLCTIANTVIITYISNVTGYMFSIMKNLNKLILNHVRDPSINSITQELDDALNDDKKGGG